MKTFTFLFYNAIFYTWLDVLDVIGISKIWRIGLNIKNIIYGGIKVVETQDMGIRDKLLFRQLLAKMIDSKIVKYVDRIQNNKKMRLFWIVDT